MNDRIKAETLQVLQHGRMEIEGVLPWSSNYAFLVTVCEDELELPAVYKPRRGERPLWDFPQGTLSQREQAAFVISEALGWELVPPTVLRDGQHGPGSVQFFIPHDPNKHYFSFEGDLVFRRPLQKMALFDVIINNADRKGGHVIVEKGDEEFEQVPNPNRLWGIDHGICFHTDYKLRTVIWEFAGYEIPARLIRDIKAFLDQFEDSTANLRASISGLLSFQEIDAVSRRAKRLLTSGTFPNPGLGRHYPWPPV